MLREGDVLEKRYHILGAEPLGQGGMGKVWKAIDKKVGSIVAVKEFELDANCKLSSSQREDLRDLFQKEAELLAGLEHEAFPKVRDNCKYKETRCIVMDFVSGEDFSELLKQRKNEPFEIFQFIEWFDQLLEALNYLHTLPNPVIHKDIKPENLKLTRNNRIKVLDFGIAKGSIGEMTLPQNSVPLGTVRYAPLEQVLKASPEYRTLLSKNHKSKVEDFIKKNTCPQSDIFSLCATSYRLLAGILPENFDAPSRALYVWSDESDPLMELCQINQKVPRKLSDLIKQGMSLEIEDRIESASAMRIALQKIKEDEIRARNEIEQENLETVLRKEFEQKLVELNRSVETQSREINQHIEEKNYQAKSYERQIGELKSSLEHLVETTVKMENFTEVQQSAQFYESKLEEINNNFPKVREEITKDTLNAFKDSILANINNKTASISHNFSSLSFFNNEVESFVKELKARLKTNANLEPKEKKEPKDSGDKQKETALVASLFTLALPIPLILAVYLGWSVTTHNISFQEKLFLLIVVAPLLSLTVPCCSLPILYIGEKLSGVIKEIKHRKSLKYIYRLVLLVFICGILGASIGLVLDYLLKENTFGVIRANIIGMLTGYAVFYILFYRDLLKQGK